MKEFILKSFYGDIFFEFILQNKPADAFILLPGFPSANYHDDIMRFLHEKGYNVFFPRYRGSYQSGGKFLETNIVRDMESFLINLNSGNALSLWNMKEKKFKIKRKILLSGSFGGAVSCGLAAQNKHFTHLILSAPVWDFKKHNLYGDEEDLDYLSNFVKKAYKNCYRYNFEKLTEKLTKIKEINPD